MLSLRHIRSVVAVGAVGISVAIGGSTAWALDPEVAALVRFETKGNAVANRSDAMIQIEHYEIPLDSLESDISKRIPADVRDSLIFEKGGKKYVRWLINPEDTKWHKEVESWLDKKGLPKTRHKHFSAYMTASRSYILEDPITKAQFSGKVSTNVTGGNWRDKKQPIDDARQVRMAADFVQDELAKQGVTHSIIMDEPAMFGIKDIDQAMIVRTLNGLTDDDHYYLPGFSAVNDNVGRKIAEKNGATNVAAFWNEHYNKPFGKALAEFSARFGLCFDSPHSQNFLVELDKDLKPTGKIVIRDFGDSYITSDFFAAKGRPDFIAKWEKDNIVNKQIHMAIGVLHGNDMPSWLTEQEYMQWGRDFFEEYETEMSKITGVPRSKLKDQMYVSGRYFSKNYSVNHPEWRKYLGVTDVSALDKTVATQMVKAGAGRAQASTGSRLGDDLLKLIPGGDKAAAAKLLTKCMQQFKNMQVPDPGNPH
jgi:hypothetical protein